MDESLHMTIHFEIFNEADISDELDKAIRTGLVECFPDDREHFTRQRWWHSKPSWSICGFDPEGNVAGNVSIVERNVSVGKDSCRIMVAGIQNFIVLPHWRKTGLSDRLMALVLGEAQQRGLDAGLLFCIPALERVYNRMGWKKIDFAVYMRNESGLREPIPSKNIAMMVPILVEQFPPGDVDLMGPDW